MKQRRDFAAQNLRAAVTILADRERYGGAGDGDLSLVWILPGLVAIRPKL